MVNRFEELVREVIESDNWTLEDINLNPLVLNRYLRHLSFYLTDIGLDDEEQHLRYTRVKDSLSNRLFLYYEVIYEVLARIAPGKLASYNDIFYSLADISDRPRNIHYYDPTSIVPFRYDPNKHTKATLHSIQKDDKSIIYYEISRKVNLDDNNPYIIRVDYPTNNSPNGYFSFYYMDMEGIHPLDGVMEHFNEWIEKINNIKKEIKIIDNLLSPVSLITQANFFDKDSTGRLYFTSNNKRLRIYKDESEIRENEAKREVLKTVKNHLSDKLSEERRKYHKDVNLELYEKYSSKIKDLNSKKEYDKVDKLNEQLNTYHKSFPKIERLLERVDRGI